MFLEEKKPVLWVYEIRGMAIIAVVVCHMQGLLHRAEWIQMLTLYSVSTLIFLMGYTKWLTLSRLLPVQGKYLGGEKAETALQLIGKDIAKAFYKVIPEYLIICFVTLGYLSDWNTFLFTVLSFSGPNYFLIHFFVLTLLAPWIYAVIVSVLRKVENNKTRFIILIGFVLLLFLVGYVSISVCDFYVQSYLSVYGAGMVFAAMQSVSENKAGMKNRIIKTALSFAVFAFGLYEVKKFYFARVAGDFAYSGGVDRFTSKLQMNPPNLSVLFYSAGCIAVFYLLFSVFNKSNNRVVKLFLKFLSLLGQYSLHIFLWHLIICNKICIPIWDTCGLGNLWIKRAFFCALMFGLPVVCGIGVRFCKDRFNKMFEAR